MARVCVLSLTLGIALELHGAYGNNANETLVQANCTDVINSARMEVGFALFAGPDKTNTPLHTKGQDNGFVEKACKAIKEASYAAWGPSSSDNFEGTTLENNNADLRTLVYAPQVGEKPDCAAAVKYWNEGFTNFNGLPPAFGPNEAVYKNPKSVSFVALYNPDVKPTVECAFLTCRAPQRKNGEVPNQSESGGKGGTGSAQSTEGKPAAQSQNGTTIKATGRSLAGNDTPPNGLLCSMRPPALVDNKSPFDEAQWKKITDVFTRAKSSTSAAVPSLLAFTVAALGMTLF